MSTRRSFPSCENHGGKSREAAEAYVEDLRKTKRYHRDVY